MKPGKIARSRGGEGLQWRPFWPDRSGRRDIPLQGLGVSVWCEAIHSLRERLQAANRPSRETRLRAPRSCRRARFCAPEGPDILQKIIFARGLFCFSSWHNTSSEPFVQKRLSNIAHALKVVGKGTWKVCLPFQKVVGFPGDGDVPCGRTQIMRISVRYQNRYTRPRFGRCWGQSPPKTSAGISTKVIA